jgi:hypothetical protein
MEAGRLIPVNNDAEIKENLLDEMTMTLSRYQPFPAKSQPVWLDILPEERVVIFFHRLPNNIPEQQQSLP